MSHSWTFLGWYRHLDGQRVGPLSAEELERLVLCGEVRPEEEVLKAWKDDFDRVRLFGSQARAALGKKRLQRAEY